MMTTTDMAHEKSVTRSEKMIIYIEDEDKKTVKTCFIKKELGEAVVTLLGESPHGWCETDVGYGVKIVDKAQPNTDVLDKIKAEIEQAYCKVENDYDKGRNYGLYMATQIIDKCKEESEE